MTCMAAPVARDIGAMAGMNSSLSGTGLPISRITKARMILEESLRLSGSI